MYVFDYLKKLWSYMTYTVFEDLPNCFQTHLLHFPLSLVVSIPPHSPQRVLHFFTETVCSY